MGRDKHPEGGSAPGKDPGSSGDTNKSFLTWLSKNGVLHPRCTIGYFPCTGRGVVATEPIKAGEQVVEVPDDAVCMAENCCIAEQLEDEGLAKATAVDPMQEVQGLILAVMAERHNAKASRWHEYLDFIPQDMTHMPMYWKEEELCELRGTAALDKMEGKVQLPADAPTQVQLAWEDVAKPFLEKHRDLKVFPRGEAACWDLYRWATAAVASYSFILGDDHYQAMVPFWDALNHITGKANVRLSHQEKRGKGGVLQMIATRDIAVGEEVVNNYGELSQAELLRAYGFVETHPEAEAHAHVQVPLRFVVQAAQAEAGRFQPEAPPPSTRQPPKGKGTTAGTDAKMAIGDQQAIEQGKGSGGGSGDSESEDGGSDSSKGGLSEFGLGGGSDEEEGCDQRVGEEAASHGDESGGTSAKLGGEAGASEHRCDGPKDGGAFERSRGRGAGVVQQGGRDADTDQPRSSKVIRGLSTRLRMCACFGLMPRSGVFKVYDPATSGIAPTPGRPFPPLELTEVARILLLPLHEVRALHQRAAAWRPRTEAQGLANGDRAKHDSQAVMSPNKKTAKRDSRTVIDSKDNNTAKQDNQTVINPEDNAAEHGSQTVIDPGPVTDELAAAVQSVVCKVVARMQGRYTSGLGDDERLLQRSEVMQGRGGTSEASREGQQQGQRQDLVKGELPEEKAAGIWKKRKGEEKELVGSKRRKGSVEGMQQQEQQQQQQQQELPPRLLVTAVVARVGEKRCLARLREWWECAAAGSCGGSAPKQQQQQQHWLSKCVRDHVAVVWSRPRPGMHRVRREESDDEGNSDEEDEESSSSSSSSSGSGNEGEGTSGDEGGDGQGAGGKAGGGERGVLENSKGRRAEEVKAGGRSRSSAGAAAKGGDAQVAATLSRPNLQQRQHFSFNFAL